MSGAGRALPLLLLAAICGLAAPLGSYVTRSASAQTAPPAEESAELAALVLQPYRIRADELPAGYFISYTSALTNEAQALEYGTVPPRDPRPAEALLGPLVASGRVVGLRQLVEHERDPAAVGFVFITTLFSASAGAAEALRDPSLSTFVQETDALVAIPAPPLGDGAAVFQIDRRGADDERRHAVVWRRGRLAFLLAATGDPAAVATSVPTTSALAARIDARLAGLPPLADWLGAPPPYLPASAGRLELYKALVDRTLADDSSGPDFSSLGVATLGNPLLLNDVDTAEAPVSDGRALYERIVGAERRLLGVVKEFQSADRVASPAGSRFPSVSLGYHLYADAAGAAEALNAPLPELLLRLSEENDLVEARKLPLRDIPQPAHRASRRGR
jgi:hypothetical protein